MHFPPELHSFCETYRASLTEAEYAAVESVLARFLEAVEEEFRSPFTFEPYHVHLPKYYQMGLDLFRPLIMFEKSTVLGQDQLKRIEKQLADGENVILLSNHQAEPDPQVISLLLEKTHPHLAQEMIFVAGHRVVTDPLAKPLSMGRNLLCIFSKRHIETPPEKREEKLQHNHTTLLKMRQLLSEGGKCIYVAPSGGRDRPGADGILEIAPFDPQSVELFFLMGRQCGRPTHFYPLSISSYHLLPPPDSVHATLGEQRTTRRTPVHLAIGKEVDPEAHAGLDKQTKREKRAKDIWQQVKDGYEQLMKE